MSALSVAIIATCGILAVELILWLFFRAKIKWLVFPPEVDTSPFRFSSLRTMGTLAIVHTIVVTFLVDFLLLKLW